MAKGAYLTPRVKQLVAQIYLEYHQQIGPTKAREELLKKMKKEGLDKIFGPNFPSVSSVSKLLGEYRENYEKRLPEIEELRKPWSTLSMAKYPIPPEALPAVLQVCVWTRENTDGKFTIREAQWAARLYSVVKDIEKLAVLTRLYVLLETTSLITGKGVVDFGSKNVDLGIYSLITGQEITPEREKKILGLSEEQWVEYHKASEYIEDKLEAGEESELNDRLMKGLYEKYVRPYEKEGGTK